jgi:hypothetical protein
LSEFWGDRRNMAGPEGHLKKKTLTYQLLPCKHGPGIRDDWSQSAVTSHRSNNNAHSRSQRALDWSKLRYNSHISKTGPMRGSNCKTHHKRPRKVWNLGLNNRLVFVSRRVFFLPATSSGHFPISSRAPATVPSGYRNRTATSDCVERNHSPAHPDRDGGKTRQGHHVRHH